jgi:tripartite-type tricarboxylate transporter receptor subunit TctC
MRARGLLVSVLSCIVMVWAAAAGAQSYPSHTVTLISPYAAGSGIDVLARLIASGLGPRLGQTIVVDAKPGAGSAIGTGFVAKAAPDGYTLMLTSSVLPVLPALYKVLPFDPTADFTHIIKLATGSMALVVNPTALPVKSLDELVKIVRAQPGKLNYASAGNGTPHHLGMELLKKELGLDIVHVPYRGATGALNDLVAGQIPMAMFPVNVVLPFAKSGKLRVLAVSGKGKSLIAPDAPTFEQLGLKNLDLDVYYFVSGPAKLPADIVARLNKEITAILTDDAMRQRLLAMGLVPDPSTPEAITSLIKADTARWKAFISETKIITPQ